MIPQMLSPLYSQAREEASHVVVKTSGPSFQVDALSGSQKPCSREFLGLRIFSGPRDDRKDKTEEEDG